MKKIDIDVNASGKGVVKIDGEPLQGVAAVRIEIEAQQPPRVWVRLVGEVSIRAETDALIIEGGEPQ